MIPESEWKWQGHPGHYCCVADCMFRMATRVGAFLVSTVGDRRGDGDDGPMTTIGGGDADFFETMIFGCEDDDLPCGCAELDDGDELDVRRYATAKAARDGHMAACYTVARGQCRGRGTGAGEEVNR